MLDAYTPALRSATPSDTALLLVTVARLQHVSSYSWLQGVLDHCQDHMMAFDGQVGLLSCNQLSVLCLPACTAACTVLLDAATCAERLYA